MHHTALNFLSVRKLSAFYCATTKTNDAECQHELGGSAWEQRLRFTGIIITTRVGFESPSNVYYNVRIVKHCYHSQVVVGAYRVLACDCTQCNRIYSAFSMLANAQAQELSSLPSF